MVPSTLHFLANRSLLISTGGATTTWIAMAAGGPSKARTRDEEEAEQARAETARAS